MKANRNIENIPIVGGNAVLDLINSVDDRDTDEPVDHLTSNEDLLIWMKRTNHFSMHEIGRQRTCSEREPSAAKEALAELKVFREGLAAVLRNVCLNQNFDPNTHKATFETIRRSVEDAKLRVAPDGHAKVVFSGPICNQLIKQLAFESLSLFSFHVQELLRLCARRGCGWFFLDGSRARNRRWCSMQDCGNVMKQRRFRKS